VFYGAESRADFAMAWAAEGPGRAGDGPPRFAQPLRYREVARYAEQLTRYIDIFGRSQVLVVLFDDFVTDPARAVADVCRHIGVAPMTPARLPIVNARKAPRSARLRDWLVRPPAVARAVARTLLPTTELRRRAAARLWRVNTRSATRPPLDPELSRRIRDAYADDIGRLAALIGRDLSSWT
jgi:hypothetical protein